MQDFHCLLQLTKQPLFLNTPKRVLFYIIRNQGTNKGKWTRLTKSNKKQQEKKNCTASRQNYRGVSGGLTCSSSRWSLRLGHHPGSLVSQYSTPYFGVSWCMASHTIFFTIMSSPRAGHGGLAQTAWPFRPTPGLGLGSSFQPEAWLESLKWQKKRVK